MTDNALTRVDPPRKWKGFYREVLWNGLTEDEAAMIAIRLESEASVMWPLPLNGRYIGVSSLGASGQASFDVWLGDRSARVFTNENSRRLKIVVPPRSAATCGVHPAVELLLRLALPRKHHDEVIGDMVEEYKEKIEPRFGSWAARLWFVRHLGAVCVTAFRLRWWILVAWLVDTVFRSR
jgi:hypothetical protein